MSKREEFIAAINIIKAASQTITPELHKGLLQQAVQEHELTINEATDIINRSGLVVGEKANYFQVLGLTIADIENQNEDTIAKRVDAAHNERYTASLRAGGLPRKDGRTQEQWRTLLNCARDTLKDAHKRREHITPILFQEDLSKLATPDILTKTDKNQPQNPKHINRQRTTLFSTARTTTQKTTQATVPQNESVQIPTNFNTPQGMANTPQGMVLIPEGNFQMGSNSENADESEKPVHTVYVDAFYMDKHLVTNAQFLTFINANPQWGKPPDWFGIKRNRKTAISKRYHDGDYLKHWDEKSYPQDKAEHPVTWVSWYAARAYAEWVGKRLPTEAEWEKAARAGQNANEYPCGNAINNAKVNYNCNVGDTTPVGQYQANSYGLYDMAGNVWEWCLDVYNPCFYKNPIHRNPIADVNSLGTVNNQVTDNTIQRVLRGGSWLDAAQLLRTAYRYKNTPTRTLAGIGFRCVKNIDVQHNHSL